ncbi:uncharacterized protein LOC134208370 [Armigeres subalbatus]|uniref:uncharacterized protein LOC134208370 n=1 Tax=Armigeres subalbatus TaxID=124917 RepID=UPI002ED5133A
MHQSRRCSTSTLVSFGCCILLLVQAIVIVHSHALPEVSDPNYGTDSALQLVEPPALDQQRSSDSVSGVQQPPNARSEYAQTRQMDLSQSVVSEVGMNKRWKLQKITPPRRSRINNRSLTALNELDSGVYSEGHQLDDQPHQHYQHQVVPRQWNTALQVHRRSDTDGTVYADEARMLEEARAKKQKKKKKQEDDFSLEQMLQEEIEASLEGLNDEDDYDVDDVNPEARKKKLHLKHKYKKFLLPLLLAYKLKFMMMFPAIVGGLALLVKAAGLAGFFFALFASVVSLQKSH